MSIQQREQLFHCEIGTAVIFLDLSRDRYFMIEGNLSASFRKFHLGSATPKDVDALVKVGLLNEGEAAKTVEETPATLPQSSCLDTLLPHPSFWLVVEAVFTQFWVRRQIKRRRLEHIMHDIENSVKNASTADREILHQVAAAFVQARRYVMYEDHCLSRGIAMMKMLARRRCQAVLSIGVTLPFAAHCWIQSGDEVLTDRLDQIRPFTPIFSVKAQ